MHYAQAAENRAFRRAARWPALTALARLARRNVLRHRGRTGMALTAIALGVAALIVAGGFINDVYIQFGEAIIHSQYGHLQVYRSGYVARGTQRPTQFIIEDPGAITSRLVRWPSVKSVLSRLRFAGTANAGGGDLPILGEGVQPALENELGSSIHLIGGRLLRGDDRYAVIVGDGVARALRVHPGDRLSINVATGEGALNTLEYEVVGIFRSHSREFDQRALRIPLATAQELLATEGVNEIVVELHDTAQTDASAARLRSELPEAQYELRTWRELADFYTKTVELFDRQFGFLKMVLLLMIVLSVSNTINTALFERLPEFGTMLALGDRRSDVFGLIFLECSMLGVVGGVFGALLGSALALVISAVGIPMPPPPNMDAGYVALIRLVPGVVMGAFAIGALSAALAGIVPAQRIARIPAVDALRRAL